MENDNIKLLQRYKDSIEKKKRDRDQAIGKRDSLLQRLKTEFGISNIALAKEKLEELRLKRKNILEEVEEKMQQLKENYEL